MQVTSVSAVPLYSGGAVWATSAENCGESEMTVIPQQIMNNKKIKVEAEIKKKEAMQQAPETSIE